MTTVGSQTAQQVVRVPIIERLKYEYEIRICDYCCYPRADIDVFYTIGRATQRDKNRCN